MPRANRHFVPGHVWHITHRCHRKAFLPEFARDRQRYLHWRTGSGLAFCLLRSRNQATDA